MAQTFTKNLANYCVLDFPSVSLKGGLSLSLAGTSGISVHAYVKPASFTTGAGDNVILNLLLDGSPGLIFNIDGTGGGSKVRIGARSTGADSLLATSGGTNIGTGSFVAIGGYVDFVADKEEVFVAGVSDGSSTGLAFGATSYTPGTSGFLDTIGCTITSGSAPTSTTPQLAGDLAEIAVWRGVLAAADFATLAAGGSACGVRRDRLIYYSRFAAAADFLLSPSRAANGGQLAPVFTGSLPLVSHPTITMPALARRRPGLGIFMDY